MELIDISKIKPAAYNPRKLSDKAFEDLKESISELGFILPIIINKSNNTIVAGHQRTKTAKILGINEVPYYSISDVDLRDEILFNQVHNGIEYEPDNNAACLVDNNGFCVLKHSEFVSYDFNASVVKEMCRLIIKYGDALCAIICDGEVVFGNNYIRACKSLNIDVNCSFIEKSKKDKLKYYLSKKYGVFNYENITRRDFVQGLAQPNRAGGVAWSPLYRTVLPVINGMSKDIHILDFGCGKGLFINKLKKVAGYKNAIGLEFFHHNQKGISIERGNKQIDRFIESIKRNGLFDVIICDAVINSVNTQEAENAVMGCLNTLLKPGGKVFFSGRRREYIEDKKKSKKAGTLERHIYFCDDDGLTAVLREGQWFFQKFLYEKQVDRLIEKNNFLPFNRYIKAGYFGVGATKLSDISKDEMIRSIDYEFNLMLPNGISYNRYEEVKNLLKINT